MIELSLETAPHYLASCGFRDCRVGELGGGVSNTVLLVETAETRFVLKQSLGKLRVEQDWYSDRERIFRECEAIAALAPCLEPGSLPEILFEDRENCLFAMSAAPAGAPTWKAQLLAGTVNQETAARAGCMLAAIARASWRHPAWQRRFADQTVFDQLRLDPYYRATAARRPDLAPQFERLLASTAGRRVCLVHGDWSPKNFLVSPAGVMAIDFEVIHFGDPAFDSGFLLNHLLLKSFYRPQWRNLYRAAAARFWQAYRAGLPDGAEWIEAATLQHLGPLLLARIDGKSPAEYIRDPALAERIRGFARALILDPPDSVLEVFERS